MGSRSDQRDDLDSEDDPGEGDQPEAGMKSDDVFRRYSDVVPRRDTPQDADDEGLDDPQVLAHELGNKVAIIGNALTLLKKQITPEALQDETTRDILRVLEEEHEGMAHMLKRVRKNSDSPSSALLPEETPEYAVINLSEMLEAEVKLWRRLLRMNIAITRDFPQWIRIRGDHMELHQVIHNLFRNAIQIMHDLPEEERRIHVRIRRKGGFVYVFIHDNGPGIKEEDRGKLFTKHFTKKKGKGIGLYYSQKLMRKIGGEISLKNTSDLKEEELDDDAFDIEVPPRSQRTRMKHEHRHGVAKMLFQKIQRALEFVSGRRQTIEPRPPVKIRVEDFKGATAIIKLRALDGEKTTEEPYKPVR